MGTFNIVSVTEHTYHHTLHLKSHKNLIIKMGNLFSNCKKDKKKEDCSKSSSKKEEVKEKSKSKKSSSSSSSSSHHEEAPKAVEVVDTQEVVEETPAEEVVEETPAEENAAPEEPALLPSVVSVVSVPPRVLGPEAEEP